MKQQQFRRSARRLSQAAGRAMVESLESRQLLSTSVDLRVVGGGGNTVTIASVGQTIDFEVWVRVEGDDGIDNEGAQILSGAFLSNNISGGAALGNLTLQRDPAFSSLGSSDGVQTDLDSDGDLDVGGTDESVAEGFFAARSPGMATDGTRDGEAEEFKVATGSFTVTSLLTGVETELAFRGRQSVPTSWLVQEDGANVNGSTGQLEVGETITLKREGTASLSGRVFDDKNATGFFDGDDTGVSGFRVFLDANFNGVLDDGEQSKPVSATGTYTFSNLEAGTYRVQQVVRDGWRTSFPGEGFYELTIGFGDVGKSLSFANTQGVLIKGFVWHDSNADRVRDPIEDPLAGWRVIVDLNENGIWDAGDISKATNSRGAFRLSLLTNGTFTVMARQIEGYRQTTNGGFPRIITLGPGDTTSNKNFGFKRLK